MDGMSERVTTFAANRALFQVREWHSALVKQLSVMPDSHPNKKVVRGKREALAEVITILEQAIAAEIKDMRENEWQSE